MSYTITNRTNFIGITFDDGTQKNIYMNGIRSVEVKGDYVIIISGNSKSDINKQMYGDDVVTLHYNDCTSHSFTDADDLKEHIFGLISLSSLSEIIADEIDSTSESGTTYIGYAKPGTTATSESTWAIMKVTDISIRYPDGLFDYKYSWDNRLTLSYQIRKF